MMAKISRLFTKMTKVYDVQYLSKLNVIALGIIPPRDIHAAPLHPGADPRCDIIIYNVM